MDTLGEYVREPPYGGLLRRSGVQNLNLKAAALAKIDLPVTITLKNLSILIPWTKLGTNPVRVVLDGL
jgi:hypothetical protein